MSPVELVPTALLFVLCFSLTFDRVHSKLHEQSGSGTIMAAGVCLTIALGLLIPPVYVFLDALMPTPNSIEPISKVFGCVATALLGAHVSRSYKSERARRLIAGRPGTLVFAVAITAGLGCFLASKTPLPSPMLHLYTDQLSVQLYIWIMLAYVAYVVFSLTLLAFVDARTNVVREERAGSWMFFGGFAISVARAVLYPIEILNPAWAGYYQLASHLSTILVVLGLAVFAHARRTNRVEQQRTRSVLSID